MAQRWITVLTLLTGLSAGVRSTLAQQCPGDLNGDNTVTVDEIITAVNAALYGCAPPTVTPTATETLIPTVPPPPTRTPTVTHTPTPTPRFADNGNGTITDTMTGLVWEKQSDDGGIHDKDNRFTWSVSGSTGPTGTAFALLLNTLNASGFGGHRDWRLPTVDELETLVSRGAVTPGMPVVPPEFNNECRPGCTVQQCSCTTALNYWTSTTNSSNGQQAWYVLFNTGSSGVGFKTLEFYARAVRGGH